MTAPRKKIITTEVVEDDAEVKQLEQAEEKSKQSLTLREKSFWTEKKPQLKLPSPEPEEKKEKKMEDTYTNTSQGPLQSDFNNKSGKKFLVIPIVIVGLILIGGGIYMAQKMMSSSNEKIVTSPSPFVETVPSPLPEATSEVDLIAYSVKVLNGGGVAGEATKVQDLLEGAGFKVSSTGNAKTFDYKKTMVQTKAKVEQDFKDKLKETLAKKYMVDTFTTLAASESAEVVVIIGSEKAK